MQKQTIFVTGATGNVGKEVVFHLLKRGHRVIASKTSRSGGEDTPQLTYRNFDFTKPDSWEPCLEGADRVFLMRPPHISNIKRDIYPFLQYLKEKEIQQVVFLSVQGAEKNKKIPHHKVETFITELGIPHTFVRPSFFMQNLTSTHLEEIRDERCLFVPTGKGTTNFIDVRDIGEICARMFLEDTYLNRGYTVTGEKSYSYKEVAELLSSGLEREIGFADPGPLRFVSYHLKKGRKPAMTLVMLALYSVVKSGRGDISTSTSAEILQRPAVSLEDFIQDYKPILTGPRQ